MVTLHGRHDPLRLMGRRLALALLALLVLSAVWEVWGVWGKDHESARLNADSQAKLADLALQQQKLQTDLRTLSSDRGMEAALRGEYAVGAAGEALIVIVEPEKPAPVQATTTLMQWIQDVFSHL